MNGRRLHRGLIAVLMGATSLVSLGAVETAADEVEAELRSLTDARTGEPIVDQVIRIR